LATVLVAGALVMLLGFVLFFNLFGSADLVPRYRERGRGGSSRRQLITR